jgi:hypothetical protein
MFDDDRGKAVFDIIALTQDDFPESYDEMQVDYSADEQTGLSMDDLPTIEEFEALDIDEKLAVLGDMLDFLTEGETPYLAVISEGLNVLDIIEGTRICDHLDCFEEGISRYITEAPEYHLQRAIYDGLRVSLAVAPDGTLVGSFTFDWAD